MHPNGQVVFIFSFFTVDTITDVPHFSSLCHLHPAPALPSSGLQHIVCVHGLYVYVLQLTPSSPFIQSPLFPGICQSVPHIHNASVLFCLLVDFVHYIPHISKIIWYLSFSDWLILLSIIISRTSMLSQRVRVHSFYSHIVFHCVNVSQLFYPLIH